MVKCPFCQYQNEDGALFCEQCKSDLALETAAMAAPPSTADFPLPTAEPLADALLPEVIPLAEPTMAAPEPMLADTLPHAMPLNDALIAIPPGAEPALAPTTEAIAAAEAAATVPAPATPTEPAPSLIPSDAALMLVVIRGLKLNAEYPLYPGMNFVGRTDEKPVDIDIEDQEPEDRVWSSRQHACIHWENGVLEIEDLNSANGTFVNRTRVYPGQKRQLAINDVIQIGTVQLRVK